MINDLIRSCVSHIGATAVTITHDMSSVRKIADRVAFLYEGKNIWFDTVKAMDKTKILMLSNLSPAPQRDRLKPTRINNGWQKKPIAFFCTDCGHEYRQWEGKCRACGAWNTIETAPKTLTSLPQTKKSGQKLLSKQNSDIFTPLDGIANANTERLKTGISEFDRTIAVGLSEVGCTSYQATLASANQHCCCRLSH